MDGHRDSNADNRTGINEPIKEFFISNHEYHPLQAMHNALGCCDATGRNIRYVLLQCVSWYIMYRKKCFVNFMGIYIPWLLFGD